MRPIAARSPDVASRVAGWGWLWQPGWGRRHHEEVYGGADDPYGFATKPYELMKYEELLSHLRDRRYARGLEVGCSEGVFTTMLAPLCDELVGTDISEVAVTRARARLDGHAGVRLERRTLPYDFPDGDFDLIVASDVVYFWEPGTVRAGLERFVAQLRPGGVLALLHYLGTFGQPTSAVEVHDQAVAIGGRAGLHVLHSVVRPDVGPHGAGYRVDVLGT